MTTASPAGNDLTLVLGATGKTGSRVASRLRAQKKPLRLGSRSASPPFDWTQPNTWPPCLEGITAVYLNYPSDLPVPGSVEVIARFVRQAQSQGVQRLVLLTGRGEAEAQAWEEVLRGIDQQHGELHWTIVRAAWFQQNFSEGAFLEMVQAGEIVLPAGKVPEPFVNLDDLADVVTAALTKPGHEGQLYEITGPRLLTFAEIAQELSRATGRTIDYRQIPHQTFLSAVEASGAPEPVVWMMDHLFAEVLDGRNAHLADGIQRALGRQPKDFSQFAFETAATNLWRPIP